MIEKRHRVRRDPTLPAEDRSRLDLFLKTTANATAYGSLARFDRRDLPDPVPVTVHGPGEQPVATAPVIRRTPARTASPRSPL